MLCAAVVALTAMACGDGGSDDPVDAGTGGADARVATLAGRCPLADRVGGFVIKHDDGFSLAEGVVADAVEPNTVLQLEHSEGTCSFLRKVNPFCDPPCGGSETCDLDETCIPAPQRKNAGPVTISGLLVDVDMEPNAVTKDYQNASLPHPPFGPGAVIELTAAGDEVEGFVLDGLGVEPLTLATTVWTMVEGQAMDIEWTPSSGPGEIYVTLNVDLHGNSPVTMHCTFEDTGSATVPESLVAKLIEFGVTPGFAIAQAQRRTVDHVELADGCVDLSVHSVVKPQFVLERP